jgi:arsenate reductase
MGHEHPRGGSTAWRSGPVKRVLFVCVHNAGRSQMAEAFFNRLAGQMGLDAAAASAGTAPGERVNPVAARAMAEVGISLEGRQPRQLTPELAAQADRIITMGCGVEADMCPAGTYISEDWQLPDPHGQSLEAVRPIRDAVRKRVEALLEEIAAEPKGHEP